MEANASREDTLRALTGLGFILLPSEAGDRHVFLDSPKRDGYDMPVVQISIYQCSVGHWCVDMEGGYRAPCVWNGPRAQWDNSDTASEFVEFLDKHHPGWR